MAPVGSGALILNDHGKRAKYRRRAQNRTDIMGIRDLVEHNDQRGVPRRRAVANLFDRQFRQGFGL